jgi:hypothetical protein
MYCGKASTQIFYYPHTEPGRCGVSLTHTHTKRWRMCVMPVKSHRRKRTRWLRGRMRARGAIRNSQEKFGAKLSGPTVGGNDDEAYKTTRAGRRESVKQTNTAAGISSNPGDHPHIFFFLDFFSRRWPSETFRCQLHILNSFSKPSVKEIS